MKPQRWDTRWLAGCGSFAGVAYSVVHSAGTWGLGPEMVARNIGGLLGGLIGGAVLVGLVSGLRNLLVAR